MTATSARFCFTICNPTDDEEQHVADTLADETRFVFGIVGREVGEGGTPHLQGFCILRRPQRMSWMRNNVSPRGHYEPARGTSVQARDYCRKDGDFDEFGSFPDRQGKRTDLDDILEWAQSHFDATGQCPTESDIAREHPRGFIKYPRLIECLRLRYPAKPHQDGTLEGWQVDAANTLVEDPDDRGINFYVDAEGGKGKTFFCRYMLTKSDDVQVLSIGKRSDIAYMLDESKSIYLFNVPRGQMEFLSYGLLEQIKDRMVISTKYAGRMKTWTHNNHVMVFSNEYPDMNKMSADRYNITELP